MLCCLILSSRCNAAWSSLPLLGCLVLPTSCYAASSSPNHVTMIALVFKALRCLIFSLFDLLHIMSCYLIWSSSCQPAWSSLPSATLLDLPFRILRCLMFPILYNYHVWLFDPVFKILRCLIFSTSCHAASPSLPHLAWCSLYIKSLLFDHLIWSWWCYPVWYSLPHAKLLDLNYLMLCCLVFSVACVATWSDLHDTPLLDIL